MGEVARGGGGQFVKGQSGNPSGRPKNLLLDHQKTLEAVVRDVLSVDRVKAIITKIADRAEQGDVKAAKLLLDKIIPNAVPDVGDPNAGRVVVFRIENATFAGQPTHEAQPDLPAIDAEVVEVALLPNPQKDVDIPQESNG